MHFLINFWFAALYFNFNFNFDITLTFFWLHIFHFFYLTNVMLSFQKSIMNPQSFLNSSKIFMMTAIKMYNMNDWKIDNVNFEDGFKFYVRI
jgi:hypothetical protein